MVEPIISNCGFKDIDEFAAYIRNFVAMDVEMTLTEEEVRNWAELFMEQEKHRITRHPEPIGLVEITDIFMKSLAMYIK